VDEEGKIEKIAGSPLVAAGADVTAALIGAAFPPFGILSSALPTLLTAPAAQAFKRRVEAAFAEINEYIGRHEEAIQNLTDGQFDFIIATLDTVRRTGDERKMEFLKTAIKNGLEEPFEHYEAQLISRIFRDISYEETRFLLDSLKWGTVNVIDKPIGGLTISHDSPERLIVAGLASIGILMQSDTIALEVNSYQFSSIAPKVAKLLTV
jgi:hypothetical protein